MDELLFRETLPLSEYQLGLSFLFLLLHNSEQVHLFHTGTSNLRGHFQAPVFVRDDGDTVVD